MALTPILYLTATAPQERTLAGRLGEVAAFEVITAESAERAKAHLAARPDIGCVICPDNLPAADPIAFIEGVRADHPTIPIVFLPDDGSEQVAAAAISAGVTEYVPESAADDPADIAATVRDAIERSWTLGALEERLKELQGIREVSRLLDDPVTKPLSEILRDIVEAVPPSFQHPDRTAAQLVVGDTRVATDDFEGDEPHMQLDTVAADGTVLELTVWYHDSPLPGDPDPFIQEEYAWVRTVLSMVRGGVERRNYVKRLQRSEALFREVAENLDDVLWVSDPESGDILYVNPEYERVWARSRDALYEDVYSFLEAIHPDDRERVRQLYDEEAASGYTEEYRIQQPDGTVRWVSERAMPVMDDAGQVNRVVGISQDITERKLRTQQLAVLNRVLRHNLRNEVTVIRGYAAEILEDSPQRDRELARKITDSTDRMINLADKHRLIADLLDRKIGWQVVDLAAVIDRRTAEIRDRYPGATLDVTRPATNVSTVAEIEMVVKELLRNAIEHNHRDRPSVSVTVTVADELVIEVADDGPGIPDIEVESLGNPEEPLRHGLGLSLWVIYWITARTGGSLSFRENDPAGTIVRVELPIGETTVDSPDQPLR